MSKSIVGIAKSTNQVELTLDDLQNNGLVPSSDISVLMPDSGGTPELGAVKATKAPEGATTGAVTGGAIGGTVGLLAGIGALAIPGLGPFIAAGPIMAALSCAAAGATSGGVAGALVDPHRLFALRDVHRPAGGVPIEPGRARLLRCGLLVAVADDDLVEAGVVVDDLVGLGIPEYEAKAYEDRIKKGGYLVAVHVEDSKKGDVVRDIMKNNDLEDISSVSEK